MAVRAEKATRRHQVEAHLRKAFATILEDVVGAPAITHRAWFTGWLESKANEVSDSTLKSYTKAINEAVAFFSDLGREDLSEITDRDCLALRDHWAKQNSLTTADHKRIILSMSFSDAVRGRLIAENVAARARALKNTERQRRKPFTSEQFATILQHCDVHWRALCLLGLYTGGQRLGDLAKLRWRNVDLAGGVISTVAQKTSAPIILPIVPALLAALKALPVSDGPDSFLFPKLAAASQQMRSFYFKEILQRAGLVPKRDRRPKEKGSVPSRRKRLEQFSFHSFRHMATSMLKAAGVGEGIAKAIVGHKSQAISDNYTHIDLGTMRAALEKLGAF